MTRYLANIRAVLFDAVGTLIRPEPAVGEAYFAVGQRFGSQRNAQEIVARFPAAFAEAERKLYSVGGALARLDGEQGGPKPSLYDANEGGLKSTLRRANEGGLKSTLRNESDVLSRPPTNQEAERRRWQTIVATVFDDLSDAAGEPFEALWRHFAQPCHWRLFDDVAPTWRALERSGRRLGIASNFDDRLAGVCRGLPPLDRCKDIYWSARVGWPKPDSAFFAAVARDLHLLPEEILLVGDDYTNDYLGAKAAGWRAVLIDRRIPEERNREISIGDLLELVEEPEQARMA